MTLILTVNGPETIWLLADRRLTYPNRPPRDDGKKAMILETSDGVSILGYAGLGATALGTEPADWMSTVLRARNLPLEQSLGVLAEALKNQLPRHLVRMQAGVTPAHTIVAASFVDGKPSLFTIDLAMEPDRKNYHFSFSRHRVEWKTGSIFRPPRVAAAGSGGLYLTRDIKWGRGLLNIVRASEDGRVSPRAVADHLACLNYDVHRGIKDKSVGPSCIVAWQHRKEGARKGGGGLQFYTGMAHDSDCPGLPTISRGDDIAALVRAMMPHMMSNFEAMQSGEPTGDLDKEKINNDLAKLPDQPDEYLR